MFKFLLRETFYPHIGLATASVVACGNFLVGLDMLEYEKSVLKRNAKTKHLLIVSAWSCAKGAVYGSVWPVYYGYVFANTWPFDQRSETVCGIFVNPFGLARQFVPFWNMYRKGGSIVEMFP